MRALPFAAVALALGAGAQHPAPTCAASASVVDALPANLPVTLRDNHFVVTVCYGERPLSFILDTGAGSTTIDLGMARELGIPLEHSIRSGGAGAARAQGASTRHDSVRIAGTSLIAPFGQAIDFSAATAAGRLRIDGVLGADFIRRYVLRLSYRDTTLRVIDREHFDYAGDGATIPLTLSGSFIFVRGELGLGDGSLIPGRFVIDVGASGPLSLVKPFVETNRLRDRVGTLVHRPGGAGVGGMSFTDVARVASFSIGDVRFDRPIVLLYGDSAGVFSSDRLGDGNVGGDLLRRYTVYFDYARRRMILERNAGTDEPFEADMTGLTLRPTPGRDAEVITWVVAGSAAASAGLAVGDTVVAIDGQPVSALRPDALRPRATRPGEKIAYTIRRAGADLIVYIVTHRLV